MSGPSNLFMVFTKGIQKPYRSNTNIVLDVFYMNMCNLTCNVINQSHSLSNCRIMIQG